MIHWCSQMKILCASKNILGKCTGKPLLGENYSQNFVFRIYIQKKTKNTNKMAQYEKKSFTKEEIQMNSKYVKIF